MQTFLACSLASLAAASIMSCGGDEFTVSGTDASSAGSARRDAAFSAEGSTSADGAWRDGGSISWSSDASSSSDDDSASPIHGGGGGGVIVVGASTDAAPVTAYDAGPDGAARTDVDARDASAPRIDGDGAPVKLNDASAPPADSGTTSADAGISDAAATNASEASAPPPSDAAAEACTTPTTFYRDRDGDGYGSTDDHISACVAPAAGDAGAWVVDPGDCRDDLPDVRPDPQDPAVRDGHYSSQGYSDPTKPGGVSFDYNCNGIEEPDPTNLYGTEPSCPVLIPGCSGKGYVAVAPERSGPNINSYCGSTTIKSCVIDFLGCKAEFTTVTQPFRCH